MKKKLLVLVFIYCSLLLFNESKVRAQSPLIDLNFDGYNGTAATIPPGIFLSWHSVSPPSFYTSAGNFGLNAPAYKFGNDGDYITTMNLPVIDSVSFWMKGNGGPFSAQNELRFYYSADSMSYTFFYSIDSLPTTGTNVTIPFNQIGGFLKIEYSKAPSGGNLAFDDFKLYSPIVIGVNEKMTEKSIKVFPTPTTGVVNIRTGADSENLFVEVYDMIGNKVFSGTGDLKNKDIYSIDLSNKNKGFYFLKIKSGNQLVTKRITLID